MTLDRAQKDKPPLPLLALAAIGVVFGDIATSPLYALQQGFNEQGMAPTAANVLSNTDSLSALCVYGPTM